MMADPRIAQDMIEEALDNRLEKLTKAHTSSQAAAADCTRNLDRWHVEVCSPVNTANLPTNVCNSLRTCTTEREQPYSRLSQKEAMNVPLLLDTPDMVLSTIFSKIPSTCPSHNSHGCWKDTLVYKIRVCLLLCF
jgi:hypothetical protein